MRQKKKDGKPRKLTCHGNRFSPDMSGLGVEINFLQPTGSFRCPASFMLMPAAKVAKHKHLTKEYQRQKAAGLLAFACIASLGAKTNRFQ